MSYCERLSFLAVILVFGVINNVGGVGSPDVPFDVNYNVVWGNENILFLNQRKEAQISLDMQSGSGFASKLSYGSGYFHMRIKLPNKDSAGVVTTYYLTSSGNTQDELDFEFLGNKEGKPITLQTNVFANGKGDREQRTLLWFDPTADFHTYKILWNQYQIVFYVDNIPIRVFKNNTNIGVMYPKQPMRIQSTIWNGENWATDGGQTKTNWSAAPFIAHYQGFNVVGCSLPDQTSTDTQSCYSPNHWWNQMKYSKLNRKERKDYQRVREKYMNYDYCTDRNRYPTPPPECASNAP